MKKILLIFFLFCSLFAVAYKWFIPHPGYAPKVFSYGNVYNRLIADSAVHIPNKTCLCTNDNDTTPQLFVFADTLRGFWNGQFWNIGFGGGSGGTDTIYVTSIGTGSPQVQLLYAVNGNLKSARLVKGLFTTPVMNSDSGVAVNIDTTGSAGIAYKLWIIAQYGPPVGGNIYTVNGRFNSNRYINAGGQSLLWDSVINPTIALRDAGSNASQWTLVDSGRDIWMQIGQTASGGGGIKQGMEMTVGGVRSGGLSGGASPYYSLLMDSARVFSGDQFGNYILMASSTFGQPGITIAPVGGNYTVYNLPTTNDSAYKPIVQIGSSGEWAHLDHWPGSGGGGGGTATIQTITSGSSGTVTGSNYWVLFDPSSTLASYTLTLPASPTIGQSVIIYFGKTITSGNVITSFTVSPNTSQSILDNTPISGLSITTDNTLQYDYIATNTWKRKKL